jgi:hypothetical protein
MGAAARGASRAEPWRAGGVCRGCGGGAASSSGGSSSSSEETGQEGDGSSRTTAVCGRREGDGWMDFTVHGTGQGAWD